MWRTNKLNGLSLNEYSALKTTLHVLDNKRFQCGVCLSQYEGRLDAEEMLSKRRKLEGCFGDTRPIEYKFDDIKYRTCPGNVFDTSSLFVVDLYRQFQKGILPYPGSLVDQPSKIMEAFNVIDAYNNKRMIEEQKKRDLASGNRKNIPRSSRKIR